jgi:hypothetical protein
MLGKIKNKLVYIARKREERWFGKRILKNSPYSGPDFMIIGAPKSGTTSLFQYLVQHPQIIPSSKKELFYFSGRQHWGIRWYLKQFPEKKIKNGKLTFDGTPTYLYYKDGLKRISRLFLDIRLIIILRDPIKRAFSQWNFHKAGSSFLSKHPKAKDKRPFKKAVQEEIKNSSNVNPYFQYVIRGAYARYLKNVYSYFNKKQVLLLDFAELKNNPQTVLKKITGFLDIKFIYNKYDKSNEEMTGLLETKDDHKSRNLKVYNVSEYEESMDKETKQFLHDYYKPYNKELECLTGTKFSWMS